MKHVELVVLLLQPSFGSLGRSADDVAFCNFRHHAAKSINKLIVFRYRQNITAVSMWTDSESLTRVV